MTAIEAPQSEREMTPEEFHKFIKLRLVVASNVLNGLIALYGPTRVHDMIREAFSAKRHAAG
jgi:hypothetical protein